MVPIQEKSRRVPTRIQDKVGTKIKNLIKDGHIVKLNDCTCDRFVAPIIITAKKDSCLKVAMDAKPMNAQIFKNQCQRLKLLEQFNIAAQIVNANISSKVWFQSLNLKHAFSNFLTGDLVSSHCNFSIVCGETRGTYRLKTGFFTASQICPKIFKRQWTTTYKISRESFVFWKIY